MLPKDLWKYVIPKYIMISKKEVMKKHWDVMWHIRDQRGCHFCDNTCHFSDCELCCIKVCEDHYETEIDQSGGLSDSCHECKYISRTYGWQCIDDMKLKKTLNIMKGP